MSETAHINGQDYEIKSFANLRGADLRGANLYGADLYGANLRAANLHGANLYGADLHGANLYGADLHGADLCGADLCGADLHGADLHGADLRGANLRGANLRAANLCGADLHGANLYGADLCGADLCGADLYGANLCDADLRDAEGLDDLTVARLSILPDEGDVIGWKKARHDVIVKLRIPSGAKRSNATGRKCRAEYAEVLEVIGADEAISSYNPDFLYRAGEVVRPTEPFSEDRFKECASGIHFFITRAEAEAF